MQKFYFSGADPDGKRISGTIVAESEETARAKLKSEDLAIFYFSDTSQERPLEEGYEKFEFAGFDKILKHVNGTIAATDTGAAYKTLRLIYEFDINYLTKESASPAEKEVAIQNGISAQLEDWYEHEVKGSDFLKKRQFQREKEAHQKEAISLTTVKEKELEIVREEIAEIVRSITALLKKNEDYIDKNKKREIEDRINLLSRLRQSNALDHLKSITQKALDNLIDDALFLQSDIVLDEEGQAVLEGVKGEFHSLNDTLNKKLKKELLNVSINIDINDIDTKRLKKNLRNLEILHQIGYVAFFTTLFIFVMMTIFWFWNIARFFIENTGRGLGQTIYYYFTSASLLGLTSYSALITMFISHVVFLGKKIPRRRKIIYSSLFVFFLFFLLVNFYSFFRWAE